MKNHEFKLIDSTYGVENAKEVLLSLINDKIKFLNRKIFSDQERFGNDTDRLEKRVAYLKEERIKLEEILNAFENEDCQVDIKCNVDLKIDQLVSA